MSGPFKPEDFVSDRSMITYRELSAEMAAETANKRLKEIIAGASTMVNFPTKGEGFLVKRTTMMAVPEWVEKFGGRSVCPKGGEHAPIYDSPKGDHYCSKCRVTVRAKWEAV